MKAMKIIVGIASIFIIAPIWYYILYSILSALNVDRLVWFLFWVYVPLGLLVGIMAKIIEGIEE
jgi:hypothetical protein